MKAKASGTPAKLDATPEKVRSGERIQRGRPPSTTAAAMAKPIRQPSSAEARAELDRDPVGVRIDGVLRPRMLASVNSPAGLRKAPITIVHRRQDQEEQWRRGRRAATPSQCSGRRRRRPISGLRCVCGSSCGPAGTLGSRNPAASPHARGTGVASVDVTETLAPTTASQPALTASSLAFTSSSVGK